MSLLNESVGQVTLTADTAPERPHLPSPEALRDDLRLADRGYFDREYLGAVDRAGGYFVMRASASVNPKVQGAYTWEGEALEGWSGQLLKQGVPSKGETVDLDVVWGEGAKALELRLLARWNPDEGCHTVVGDESAASDWSRFCDFLKYQPMTRPTLSLAAMVPAGPARSVGRRRPRHVAPGRSAAG